MQHKASALFPCPLPPWACSWALSLPCALHRMQDGSDRPSPWCVPCHCVLHNSVSAPVSPLSPPNAGLLAILGESCQALAAERFLGADLNAPSLLHRACMRVHGAAHKGHPYNACRGAVLRLRQRPRMELGRGCRGQHGGYIRVERDENKHHPCTLHAPPGVPLCRASATLQYVAYSCRNCPCSTCNTAPQHATPARHVFMPPMLGRVIVYAPARALLLHAPALAPTSAPGPCTLSHRYPDLKYLH